MIGGQRSAWARVTSRFSPSAACVLYIFIFLTVSQPTRATSFSQCLTALQAYASSNGTNATGLGSTAGLSNETGYGLRDNKGRIVTNISDTTAIAYNVCDSACGAGQEPFQWSIFSQQFGAWLLPWLALVSQLPFGAKSRLGNLQSVFLTIGSPALAAYSLALTILNARWVSRRFSGFTYPNAQKAVSILSSLQQAPLYITDDTLSLASLVVLPNNDEWWAVLAERLDYTNTWSISAATSIAWVVIAYVFTVVDSFHNVTDNVEAQGQGVGSIWLWLIPIVVGWLQISPKCDFERLEKAFYPTTDLAYIATREGVAKANDVSGERAISLHPVRDGLLRCDEDHSPPIYNYARFLPWVHSVETVAAVFAAASYNARARIPVDRARDWVPRERDVIDPQNRTGVAGQVLEYCDELYHAHRSRSRWGPEIFTRVVVASAAALFLQWGTTGSAIIVLWFTPTMGLGCRSGSYILYGILSTVTWMLLVASSFLTHYSDPPESEPRLPGRHGRSFSASSGLSEALILSPLTKTKDPFTSVSVHPVSYSFSKRSLKCRPRFARTAIALSIIFRWLGKLIAVANTIWLVLICMFQFSSFFDRCYCDGSVLGLGAEKAYVAVTFTKSDVAEMRGGWIGGVVFGSSTALLFGLFVNIFADDLQ